MKTCKNCNQTFDDTKKFCKLCGAPLTSDQHGDPQLNARKQAFEEKLKAFPLNTSILLEYAEFLINNPQFEKATEFNYSSKNAESLALVYSILGKKEIDKGEINRAKRCLKESLLNDFQNFEIKNNQEYISRKIRSKKLKKIFSIVSLLIVIVILIAASLFLINRLKALEELKFWENAKQKNTSEIYQLYRDKYPEGKFLIEADSLLESALWTETKRKGDFISYKNFLEKYPNTRFFNQKEAPRPGSENDPFFVLKEGDTPYFRLAPSQSTGWLVIDDFYKVNFYSNNDFFIEYRNGIKKLIKKESNNSIPSMGKFKILALSNFPLIVGLYIMETKNITMKYCFNFDDELWVPKFNFKKDERIRLDINGSLALVYRNSREKLESGTYFRTLSSDGKIAFSGESSTEVTISIERN